MHHGDCVCLSASLHLRTHLTEPSGARDVYKHNT